MALTTLKSIEKAFSLVDAKKDNLKKAFQDLQAHPSLLSSLNFSWHDLDSYFTSIQSHLHQKFSALQALQSSPPKLGKPKEPFSVEPVPARPELKSLCEKMDGLGLRKYVIDRPKERGAIRVELPDAFKHAPDPGSLVLDALEGFWDGEESGIISRLRTVCVVLMEELMRSGVEIRAEARERAMATAVAWKGKMGALQGGDGDDEWKEEGGLERLGYLQLLATYKLCTDGGFDESELIKCVVFSARYRQAVDLCRILGLESKVSDVIRWLINKGRQLIALKFIFEFELTEEFPPVPLLKAFVTDSKINAHEVCANGKNSRQSMNDAAMKEISALKSAIKCIEEHGLESQYPKDELVRQIEKLEKEKSDRKKPPPAAAPKPQQPMKPAKKTGSKRTKLSASGPAFKRKHPANPVFHPPQPSSVNRAGLLPDHHAATHLNSSASAAYGLAGQLVAAAPYVGSSTDLYGLPGTPAVGFPGNLNPSSSNPYPPEMHAQPGYYDRAVGYGGYDLSGQYHPTFYPQ